MVPPSQCERLRLLEQLEQIPIKERISEDQDATLRYAPTTRPTDHIYLCAKSRFSNTSGHGMHCVDLLVAGGPDARRAFLGVGRSGSAYTLTLRTRCCRGLTDAELALSIDLRPFMQRTPFVVHGNASLARAYRLFRTMGLHHLFVGPPRPCIMGLITRKVTNQEYLFRKDTKKFTAVRMRMGVTCLCHQRWTGGQTARGVMPSEACSRCGHPWTGLCLGQNDCPRSGMTLAVWCVRETCKQLRMQDVTEENSQLVLGAKANQADFVRSIQAASATHAGLPFMPYHRLAKGGPKPYMRRSRTSAEQAHSHVLAAVHEGEEGGELQELQRGRRKKTTTIG